VNDPTSSDVGDNEESAALSIGAILRNHRETAGLTVQDVAARLRLDIETIRILEASRFEELAASAYVRGYIRNYARLFGVEAEPLIRQFNTGASAPPAVRPYAESRPPTQASSSDSLVKAVTYAVIAILVLLLMIWWQTQFRDKSEPASEQQSGAPDATIMAPPKQPPQLAPTPRPEFSPDADLPASTEDLPPVPDPQAAPDGDSSENAGVTFLGSEAPANSAEQPGNVLLESPAPIIDSGAGVDGLPGDIPSSVATTFAINMQLEPNLPAGMLVIKTRAEAWVEVYDANEKQLHYNLVSPGRRLTLTGARPFRLRLGNSPEVVVQYQGTILDLTPFSTGGIARFHVGAEIGPTVSSTVAPSAARAARQPRASSVASSSAVND
jgi:cytoskeleton protein RodZ